MDTNLKNSIWPNGLKTDSEGNAIYYPLGTNKVEIPDGTTVQWPEGDALVGNFVFKNGKLVGLVDTKALIPNETGSSTINYDYTNIKLHFSESDLSVKKGDRAKYFTVTYLGEETETPIMTFTFTRFTDISTDRAARRVFRDTYKVDNSTLYDKDNNIIGYFNSTIIEVGSDYSVISDELYPSGAPVGGLFWDDALDLGGPEGFPLTTFNSDLNALVDGQYTFANCINLTSFTGNLDKLNDGTYMFAYCESLDTFNTNSLNTLEWGSWMFGNCVKLESFDIDLSNLINGSHMFTCCHNLSSFTSNLDSLVHGDDMFFNSGLTSFNVNLETLKYGGTMFKDCKKLTSFNSNLKSLTFITQMFKGCTALTTFNANLENLKLGWSMFEDCPIVSFTSNLKSLTNGEDMFNSASLNTASVQNIAETINDVTELETSSTVSKIIDIRIGNTTPNTEEVAAFNTIASKGWTVYVNGSDTPHEPSAVPATEECTEGKILQPYYAKAIEASEENAKYFGADNKFYKIVGGQFIYGDDLSTYGMFTSLEDAAANMRLAKIERN